MSSGAPDRVSSEGSESHGHGGGQVKTCADCGTTKTPLWRGGPAGPKSLCNACGIRSRKKRKALLGLNKTSTPKKPAKINTNNTGTTTNHEKNSKLEASIRREFLEFQGGMTWPRTKVRRKLGEEEQAAMLLMALSCGSVYA